MSQEKDYTISRAAEDKIIFKLGLLGNDKCSDINQAYTDCIQGRTVSVLWACRDLYKASQACMNKYVTQDNVDLVKRRWVDAGRPTMPDWKQLLAGIDQL